MPLGVPIHPTFEHLTILEAAGRMQGVLTMNYYEFVIIIESLKSI